MTENAQLRADHVSRHFPAEGDGLRAQQLKELARVRSQLAVARRQQAQAAVEYASTPDGAAETFRRYELAATEAERDELRNTYLAGLQLASQEYEQRVARGSATARDGHLQTVQVGAFTDPVARALIAHRVMATYRSGPAAMTAGSVTMHLFVLLPDGVNRRRARITTPAPLGTVTATLADVIATAWADKATRVRITDLVGPTAATDLDAAITERSVPKAAS